MYGKVFASLFHGSMVGQRDAQHVFVYLISHADRNGHVDAHPTEVSALTGIPMTEVEDALTALQEADTNSRSAEQDGRRIERIGDSWTWFIVNYGKYLTMQDLDAVRDQTKARVRRHRDMKRPVTVGNASKREVEVEVEVERVNTLSPTSPNGSVWRARFDDFWTQWPRKQAKKAALKAWRRISPDSYPAIVSGIESARQTDEWKRGIIPHPATWLNGERWKDESGPPEEPDPLARAKRLLADPDERRRVRAENDARLAREHENA